VPARKNEATHLVDLGLPVLSQYEKEAKRKVRKKKRRGWGAEYLQTPRQREGGG